jgi:hypothetical protein
VRGMSLTGLRDGIAGGAVVVGNVMVVVIGNVTMTGAGGKDVHWAAGWGKAYIAMLERGQQQYNKPGRERRRRKDGKGDGG